MEYKISKTRLTQLIKEEYEAMNGPEEEGVNRNSLEDLIWQWHKEGKKTPVHLTVARMIEDGNLDGAINTIEDLKTSSDSEEDTQTESLGTIRNLIKQEIAKL